MGIRVLDFTDGFTSATAPTAASIAAVTGTYIAPTLIVAGTGIVTGGYPEEIQYVYGTGGVDITAIPQVSAGTADGDRIVIVGTSDTDFVLLQNGDGLSLNGDCQLNAGSMITLVWSASNTLWIEEARNDV